MRNMTKENAVDKMIEMFRASWTWGRMTDDERERFLTLDFSGVKGTAKQRAEMMNALYRAFLAGLGYDGWQWREPDPAAVQF